MKKLISLVLVVSLFAVSIAAQENQPLLIDEFGSIPLGETMARIDQFAVVMANTPNSKALARIYGGQGESFVSAYVRGSVIKGYWNNSRRFPAERLSIQFCNINKEPIFTQFFIVRENDKVETCDENLTVPKETVLFEGVYFYSPTFKLTPQENTPVEHGPSEGEYSGYAQNILKRLLNEAPESKVYIIAYLQTNFKTDYEGKIISRKISGLDKRFLSKRMIQAARNELIKNGFSPAQIVAIDGGYASPDGRRLEFWFVPKGGAIPNPKPDYIPKKTK
jgi:hypothetical protein